MDYRVVKDPSVWGGPTWIFLHCVSFSYPNRPSSIDKKNYKAFFYSLQNVLPCKKCQEHYQEYLKKKPIEEHLQSRQKLSKYVIELHNHININYKKQRRLSYSQAKDEIFNFCMQQKIK
jgi:FAD-linked sulfhydryl oxidase